MQHSVILFATFMLLTGLEAGGKLVDFEHCYVKWISDFEYIFAAFPNVLYKCISGPLMLKKGKMLFHAFPWQCNGIHSNTSRVSYVLQVGRVPYASLSKWNFQKQCKICFQEVFFHSCYWNALRVYLWVG